MDAKAVHVSCFRCEFHNVATYFETQNLRENHENFTPKFVAIWYVYSKSSIV